MANHLTLLEPKTKRKLQEVTKTKNQEGQQAVIEFPVVNLVSGKYLLAAAQKLKDMH
jgi:hypothetical protein